MIQEETEENFGSPKSTSDLPEENANTETIVSGSSGQINSQEIENLPIQSIGSYARLEELVTDEDSENTGNPGAQS